MQVTTTSKIKGHLQPYQNMPGYTMAEPAGTDMVTLEKKLQDSALSDTTYSENPPTPPPKDEKTFRSPTQFEPYFNPLGVSRADSIFSLSRASLAYQLSQLTSINLPDAPSLSSTISSLPTAAAATKALSNAATQIQAWIRKAAEVLGGLDAEDDVEWATAGGRDGIGDVEAAIKKFEQLVVVFIAAVESVQKREDINTVTEQELKRLLDVMEAIVAEWDRVLKSLDEIKRQVQLAMEWEEIWNAVIGAIGLEIDDLNKLIFEIEERRHNIVIAGPLLDDNAGIDLKELETIVEESPIGVNAANKISHRIGLSPAYAGSSPLTSPGPESNKGDPQLVALFGRLQPLRASLDFLPKRILSFRSRAESAFPSSCAELDARQQVLETKYKDLVADSEIVRRELEEDRWINPFRNTGRQVQKMCESIERNIIKLDEALESEMHIGNSATLAKKISDYEVRKNSYGSAVQKILAIMDIGFKDRLTSNGEISRIVADARSQWSNIESQIKVIDGVLEDYHTRKTMRDSISTIVSYDISTTDSIVDTPASSPTSSIVMGPSNGNKNVPATPDLHSFSRRSSSIRSVSSSRPSTTRRSGNPSANGSISRIVQYSSPMSRLSSASPSPSLRPSNSTPTPGTRLRGSAATNPRPRWNSSPIVDYGQFGHHKRPTSAPRSSRSGTPSQYSYRQTRVASSTLPSPLSYKNPLEPASTRPGSITSLGSYDHRDKSSSTVEGARDKCEIRPRSRMHTASNVSIPRIPSTGSATRMSLLPVPSSPSVPLLGFDCKGGGENVGNENGPILRPKLSVRPATSLAMASDIPSGRRSSMLPLQKVRAEKEERNWKS